MTPNNGGSGWGWGSHGLWPGGQTYADKVLATQRANLIAYWPLWEASGATADNYEGTAARDGTYSGVTLGQPGIGDGRTCPLWSGNDYMSGYTTSMRDAFSGAAGTVFIWVKVSGLGVWTDGTTRLMCCIQSDSQNYIYLRHPSYGNNRLEYIYEAGDTQEVITKNPISDTSWFTIALTWSKADDEVIAYYNGVQEGSTATGVGTWAGSIDRCLAGALSTTPSSPWDGYLAHFAVWTKVLTAAELLSLSSV